MDACADDGGAALAPGKVPGATAANRMPMDRQTWQTIAALLALSVGASAQPLPEPVLGPAHDVATIARLGDDRPGAWTPKCGVAVAFSLTPNRKVPGVEHPVLDARVWQKDKTDHEPSHTWFALERHDLPPVDAPSDLDGFRIVLGSETEARWWVSVTLTAAGEGYTVVLDANPFPARRMVGWLVPLDRFRSPKGKALTADGARAVRGVAFATSSAGTSLLFDRITAYRRARLAGWLDFTTSRPSTNLFERRERVSMALTPGGVPPERAVGYRYEVRNYAGSVVRRGSAHLSRAQSPMLPATSWSPGYYEVCAYWIDAGGKDLQSYSCIRAEGTVPDGIGTFAVVPNTVATNRARSKQTGEKAFFGLHGDFLGLGDYIGLTWRFGYTAWPYLEPTRPDRSSGSAPWATKALAGRPEPPYRFHILPFILNGTPPAWANAPGAAPGYRWDDGLAMVRDSARVEKHLYPHMARRLYGGLWEVDLNGPPYGTQTPTFGPADIVDAYRRVRATVKAVDRDALVIGPCSSVIRPAWFEDVFKAGVLDHVDGIETHSYAESCYSQEADDLPGRLHALKALIRKYHQRKDLPIYVTECGQPGILGSDVDDRSQAERMVRTCIILKGEGVRVFMPFYGIDYDRTGGWGFMYNLEMEGPSRPWGTRRTCPKPMVIAVAACVDMLEGTTPVGRLPMADLAVWAYAFRRGGETVTAAWAPFGRTRATVRIRGASARVVDMMGRSTLVAAKSGVVRLSVGPAPVYVVSRPGR